MRGLPLNLLLAVLHRSHQSDVLGSPSESPESNAAFVLSRRANASADDYQGERKGILCHWGLSRGETPQSEARYRTAKLPAELFG